MAASAVAGQSPPLNTICDAIVPLSPIPQKADGTIERYIPGQYYTIRMSPNNDITNVGSGNYLILDFCDALAANDPPVDCNHGGSTVRDLLSGATQGCITLNTPICTKPGVSAGPVQQGLNARFAQDTVRPNTRVAQAVLTGTPFIRMREAMTRDDSFFHLFRLSHMFGRLLPVERIVPLTFLLTAASSCESKFLEAMEGISMGNLSGGAPRADISIPARPLLQI